MKKKLAITTADWCSLARWCCAITEGIDPSDIGDDVRLAEESEAKVMGGLREDLGTDLVRLNRVGPLKFQPALYALIRTFEPKLVVETGIYNGVSTVVMLKALHDEGGPVRRLISMDPDDKTGAHKIQKATGVDVKRFGVKWTYMRKRGIDGIPDIYDPIDMFVLDSDTSARNIRGELKAVTPRLSPGAIVVVNGWDRIKAEDAFADWMRGHGLERMATFSTCAIVRMPYLAVQEPDPQVPFEVVSPWAKGAAPSRGEAVGEAVAEVGIGPAADPDQGPDTPYEGQAEPNRGPSDNPKVPELNPIETRPLEPNDHDGQNSNDFDVTDVE